MLLLFTTETPTPSTVILKVLVNLIVFLKLV